MRTASFRLLSLLAACGLLLGACGQEAANLEQPGADTLAPVTTATGDGTRLAVPMGELAGLAPEARPPQGPGADYGVVVPSGVNPLDDCPLPPDFVRSE